MSFPAPSVIPPSLSNWQYQFAGLSFGAQEPWAVVDVSGLDLPKVRSGDSGRPRDTGEFEGLDFLGGRDISFTLHTQQGSSTALRTQLAALEAVMLPPADAATEQPLWIQRPGLPLLAAMVRPRSFGLKSSYDLARAHHAQPVCAFHATDPRLYGPTQALSGSSPSIVDGLSFPIVFSANSGKGLSFGGGSLAVRLSPSNGGTIETRPLLTVTGPCANPQLTLISAAGSPTIGFGVALNAGDQLVIDTDAESALYYTAGSSRGSSRLSSLMPGSVWWTLPPGTSTVQFLTSTPGSGSVQLAFAPAYASAA